MTSSATTEVTASKGPPGPHDVETLRRARQLFRDPSTALDGLLRAYGPISALRLGPTPHRRDRWARVAAADVREAGGILRWRHLNDWIPMIVARTDTAIDRLVQRLDGNAATV